MRNASGHQCKVKVSGSEKKDKKCNYEVSESFTLQSCKITAKKCTCTYSGVVFAA